MNSGTTYSGTDFNVPGDSYWFRIQSKKRGDASCEKSFLGIAEEDRKECTADDSSSVYISNVAVEESPILKFTLRMSPWLEFNKRCFWWEITIDDPTYGDCNGFYLS